MDKIEKFVLRYVVRSTRCHDFKPQHTRYGVLPPAPFPLQESLFLTLAQTLAQIQNTGTSV